MTLTRLICLAGGLVLIAPGLCTLWYMLVAAWEFRGTASDLRALEFLALPWLAGLGVGALGVKLVADGLRAPGAGRTHDPETGRLGRWEPGPDRP